MSKEVSNDMVIENEVINLHYNNDNEVKLISSSSSSSSSDSNLPWVEKYRPSGLDQLISHQEIIQTITRLIDSNRLPHLLLYGPPGVGKTSTILAIARRMYGARFGGQILELNASDDRGIDVVREQIKDFASSRQLFSSGLKLIVLDECDSMTKAAQFALRRIIEKYTRHTRFCLIANYVNKIIPALQSRCTRFRFAPLKPEQIQTRIKEIAMKEKVVLTSSGINAIIGLSEGDMRKCLNILQAASLAYEEVNEENVYLCTGNPLPSTIELIYYTLLNESIEKSYSIIKKIQEEKGLALVDIISRLHSIIIRTQFPPTALIYLLTELSDAEYRLSSGSGEKIQLIGLVAVFQLTKDIIRQHKS